MTEIVSNQPSLYVVATPIGNLGDMSNRAVDVLESVDLIAAEDTRHSAKLLQNFGIDTPMLSCHDFSSHARQAEIVEKLQQGLSVALISDAGTPTVADPGYELVNLARSAGIAVITVPGPSSIIAALSISGIPSDRFVFEGFLPAKLIGREKALSTALSSTRTIIFLETPHRIVASLESILKVLGPERSLFIGRELTKLFEESYKGSVEECLAWIKRDSNRQKGEFVLILSGLPKEQQKSLDEQEGRRVLDFLSPRLPVNEAVKLAAKISGASRNGLYHYAMSKKSDE